MDKPFYKRVWEEALVLAGARSFEESLIRELAEYRGVPASEIKRSIVESKANLKREWQERKRDVKGFYVNNEYYLYDLTRFHANYGRSEAIVDVLEFLKDNNLKNILDFGGGIGSTAILFAKENFTVAYADIAKDLSSYAKWRLRRRNLKADFIDLNIERLPHNAFDVVIATEVLEHVEDPSDALSAIQHSLKEEGYLFFNITDTPGEGNPMHVTEGIDVLKIIRGLGFERLSPNPVSMHGFVKVKRPEAVNKILRRYDTLFYYPLRLFAKRILNIFG